MASLNFNDYYFFLNPILLLTGLWLYFFKLNSNFTKINSENSTNVNVLKINSNTSFIGYYYYLVCFNLVGVYTIHGKNLLVWFNHFNISNFTLNLLYMFLMVSFSIFFLLKISTQKTNLVKSIDYLFSINNLVIILPYLFFVNTVFTFLFLLELISVVLLYNLISSKIWFKNTTGSKQVNNTIPQNYINMVFFQYWVTFFSTIFIIYFYINIFYMYGTSDWYIFQFLDRLDPLINTTRSNTIRVLVSVFLLSILFKLGVTPFHLFKIEVYKGIPFLSIFFYTTYYFVVFFLFFLFFLSDFFAAFISQYYTLLSLLLLSGSLYVLVLLFDVSFLKAFFTYSTVINSIGFLVAFVASL